MGLFDKFFGRKDQNTTSETTGHPTHKQEWDFYFSTVDDSIGSFYIDLGLASIAPISDRPFLVWISLQMNCPREDGLSSNEEFETLRTIEDRLQDFMVAKHKAIYTGRLTTDGRRDFYFYLGDTTLHDKTISEAMVAFPTYAFDVGIKEDNQWEQYLGFMYPSDREWQSIQNRRVIDNLKEHGDPLTKARPVDHWIFFKTAADKEKFLSKISDEGFTVVANDYDTALGETPYQLQLSRVDKVDHKSVDDYVLHLWQLAEESEGEYNGWETSVEKE
ncbi:MAG TPA: DUF695 domain-containing protein [Flavisolibacter sp.]|nr:DUF695 domain-containing protein [Flavisolibacter sp.]